MHNKNLIITKSEGLDRYERLPIYTVAVLCPETSASYCFQIPSWLHDNPEQIANELYRLGRKHSGWTFTKLVSFLSTHPDGNFGQFELKGK